MAMGTIASYGYNVVALIFIGVIFSKVNTLGGWDKWHMVTLYGVSQMIFYFYVIFFWSCHQWLGRAIASGEIDRFLLRPVWTIAELVTYKFNLIMMLPSLFLGMAICAVGIEKSGGAEWLNMIIFLVDIPISVAITVLPPLMVALFSFWVVDTQELSRTVQHVSDLRHYPLEMYPRSVQVILIVLPLAVVAYVPTRFLYFAFDWRWLVAQITTLVALIFLARSMWHKGLRIYSSVSG